MQSSFEALLRALVDQEVELVVVGGVAAILEGVPMTTLDLDIVYRVEDRNLARLVSALASLGARYRDPAGRHIAPTEARLRSNKINLLETRVGLLDALQEIGGGWRYAELVERSIRMEVWGLELQVLRLEAAIHSKEAAGRPKDRAQLPLLRETLRLKGERS